MSDNWIVQNLENALNTWNQKLAEIWQLITQPPDQFKGGTIWKVIVDIHGAVQAIGLALLVASALIAANENAHEHATLASEAGRGRTIAFWIGGLLFVLAHASLEAGRGWLAADARLRSALKAWWRGLKLLCKRPFAVLSVYLATTLSGLLLAAGLLLLRPYLGHGGVGALLAGLLLSGAIAAALAWSRIARLFGMQALAEDMHARR